MTHFDPFVASLDELIEILSSLVDVAQREQAGLIGFQAEVIVAANEERAALLARQQSTESRVRGGLKSLFDELEIPQTNSMTLCTLAHHLPQAQERVVTERRSGIESLLVSLTELHRMNSVQAERGLRTVRGCISLMTGVQREAVAPVYTRAAAISQPAPPAGSTMQRSL